MTALRRAHGDAIYAVALYGSMGRDADGPYSDIELWAALTTPGMDDSAEWVYGPGKAEVNLLGLDVLWEQARTVAAKWALEQGQFVRDRE